MKQCCVNLATLVRRNNLRQVNKHRGSTKEIGFADLKQIESTNIAGVVCEIELWWQRPVRVQSMDVRETAVRGPMM